MDKALQTSNSAEWYTPLELYEQICDVANAGQGFDLDPCAEPENRLKTKHFWTAQDNGLDATKALPADCYSVFLNPPYGRQMTQWVERFNNHFAEHTEHVQAWLVPARTDTRWFQDLVQSFPCVVVFLSGRVKFISPDGSKDAAPFPSAIVMRGHSMGQMASMFAHAHKLDGIAVKVGW